MNLEDRLAKALNQYLDHGPGRHTPPHLAESIRYSLLGPGKRFRPRLLISAAKMMDLSEEIVFPAALSLEMIHCFTLIHDDLPCMDNDSLRRGLPTNHKKFGEALALLAGDSLMAIAIDVFLDSPIQLDRLFTGLRHLCWAMGPRGVIGGQAAETLLNSSSHIDDLRSVHLQKTGALFQAALLIPQAFANIPSTSPAGQAIHFFGHALGLAFQAADDLEDLNKSHPPKETSILYYLSPHQIKTEVADQLSSATKTLIQEFKEKSAGLQQVADEILHKVKNAG